MSKAKNLKPLMGGDECKTIVRKTLLEITYGQSTLVPTFNKGNSVGSILEGFVVKQRGGNICSSVLRSHAKEAGLTHDLQQICQPESDSQSLS